MGRKQVASCMVRVTPKDLGLLVDVMKRHKEGSLGDTVHFLLALYERHRSLESGPKATTRREL